MTPMTMTAIDFAHDRAEAIREYSKGRHGWEVLGVGNVGGLGAVRVRDGYGYEGLVVQQFEGADKGELRTVSQSYYEISAA